MKLSTPSYKVLNKPADLFVHLTQYTVPFGCESHYYGGILKHFGFTRDSFGNWFASVGNSTTAFAAHMDTASSLFEPIRHRFAAGEVGTDGSTILGADDRAGMTVLLHMFHRRRPGLYCLFTGEERGCIGSKQSAMRDQDRYQGIERMISFDRRGTSSIVTHQCFERTCSEEFAEALSARLSHGYLSFAPDPTGLFTDSLSFSHIIPECTNISVGYEAAHSIRETQDLDFLTLLCERVCRIRWDSLPVSRDPNIPDFGVLSVGDYYQYLDTPVHAPPSTTQDGFNWNTMRYEDEAESAWERLDSATADGRPLRQSDLDIVHRIDSGLAHELCDEYRRFWGRLLIIAK